VGEGKEKAMGEADSKGIAGAKGTGSGVKGGFGNETRRSAEGGGARGIRGMDKCVAQLSVKCIMQYISSTTKLGLLRQCVSTLKKEGREGRLESGCSGWTGATA